MSLEQRLTDDMKAAMKDKDRVRLATIRMLRSEVHNARIARGADLDDDQILEVVGSAAKKRREAIEQFQAVGQADRAAEEAQELAIIESYLPEQLDDAEIEEIVRAVIAETGAASMKDMGQVMGAVMPKVKGKADGKRVQTIVRNQLAAG